MKERVLKKDILPDEVNFNLHQALKKYDEALLQKVNKEQHREILCKLYSNVAFIHIRLRNFGKAIQFAEQSLKLDPNFVKAFYRKAKAELCLKKYQ